MSITLLYSDIWPLKVKKDKEIISERFLKELEKADELRIFTAYFAQDFLRELDKLVRLRNIKKVILLLGMYKEKIFRKVHINWLLKLMNNDKKKK